MGQTSRTTQIRETEHRYAALQGTEAKYQHIRKIWDRGQDFELVLLETIDTAIPNHNRYEDYWVYLLSQEYDLTNMRAGDAKSMATQSAMRSMAGKRYSGAGEFFTALDREVAAAEARRRAAAQLARARQPKEPDVALTRFVGDYGINGTNEKNTVSSGLQELLARRKR